MMIIYDHSELASLLQFSFQISPRHSIATQGSIRMTYQQFRALKGVWPKPDVATPTNRSAIFHQKFKAGNLCCASLVESHQGSREHSQPWDTSPLQAVPKLMSATPSAHCYLLRWIFHQEWQDFFPSPSLPTPLLYLLAWQLVTATSLPRWLSLKPDLCSFLRPVVVPSLSHSNHFWQETCWSQQRVLAPETHWDYTGKSGYSVLSPS